MEKIILASGSPRRKELLIQAGIPFEVLVSDADEKTTETDPAKTVMELALRKARAAARQLAKDAVILGADTVVALDGSILGKPTGEEDAARMLRTLSGKSHQVYTGVALVRKKGQQQTEKVFFEKTDVEMYAISEEEIAAYIATGEPMDKAGAYGIQGKAAIFVRGIRGDYNTVVGLPAARVYQELKAF
ncbi:MAG TPA: septum formation inhibitor Maf [Candidatus Limivivens intestinipullorum]|uniref:dTTP/UTP pyrophosphatase n=1 Tax=Candidatus Limivivens intestinipullorum TaxID=2840858 RepID=A0A9D1ES49_9FIRM|nr:septum formation inhibitor Maf [Candidatus Limivivens intestinipullorum]